MAKAIYDQIDTQLKDLQAPRRAPGRRRTPGGRNSRSLSSTGVIQHITDNMEIVGRRDHGRRGGTVIGHRRPGPARASRSPGHAHREPERRDLHPEQRRKGSREMSVELGLSVRGRRLGRVTVSDGRRADPGEDPPGPVHDARRAGEPARLRLRAVRPGLRAERSGAGGRDGVQRRPGADALAWRRDSRRRGRCSDGGETVTVEVAWIEGPTARAARSGREFR